MATFRQDMPPPGGYAPIVYQRVPIKRGINSKISLIGTFVITALGWVGFHIQKEKELLERIEMRCVNIALHPMLQAEADRALLKQFKKNRDMEEEIMKDVKGWEVGKWKGSPIYLTLGPDEYFPPSSAERYAHAPPDAVSRIRNIIFSN